MLYVRLLTYVEVPLDVTGLMACNPEWLAEVAQQHLDNFRESSLPGPCHGLTLARCRPEDLPKFDLQTGCSIGQKPL